MTEREEITQNAIAYMIIVDLDKPFHRPECECDQCEQWRNDKDRPTHKELRDMEDSKNATN